MEFFKKEKKKPGRPRNIELSYIVNFRLNKTMYDKLQEKAMQRGCAMSSIIKDALKKYFGVDG